MYESNDNINPVNNYSYLRHEFEQAIKKHKEIVIFYNSVRNEINWLPEYMKDYVDCAHPFWIIRNNKRIANYDLVKRLLNDV